MPVLLTCPEAIAHHEAGHAVMCILLGHSLRRVAITPNADGPSMGCTWSSGRPAAMLDLRYFGGLRGERYAREAIMICFAGPVAEQRWMQSDDLAIDWAGDESDGGQVRQLLRLYTDDRRERRALAGWLLARTRAALRPRPRWAMVRAVAKALLERESLSGRAAREIAWAAMDTLPRGKPAPAGAGIGASMSLDSGSAPL